MIFLSEGMNLKRDTKTFVEYMLALSDDADVRQTTYKDFSLLIIDNGNLSEFKSGEITDLLFRRRKYAAFVKAIESAHLSFDRDFATQVVYFTGDAEKDVPWQNEYVVWKDVVLNMLKNKKSFALIAVHPDEVVISDAIEDLHLEADENSLHVPHAHVLYEDAKIDAYEVLDASGDVFTLADGNEA